MSTWNFAYVITSGRLPTMQILVLIGTVGASPHTGEILPPCDFFWLSCLVLSFFSRERARSNRWTIFTLYGSNYVIPRKEVPFGGQDDGWRLLEEIYPQNPHKWAWIGNFKPKRQNIKITISPNLWIRSRPNLRTNLRPTTALRGWSNVVQIKSNMAAGRHLEKSIWRHNSAKGCSILTKYGRPMQNDTPMTKIRQK